MDIPKITSAISYHRLGEINLIIIMNKIYIVSIKKNLTIKNF